VPRLEVAEAFEHLDEGVLHEVLGVERATGPGGQPAVGPALKAGEVADAKLVLRCGITGASPTNQFDRRLGLDRLAVSPKTTRPTAIVRP
jgi:hypothetical protein